MDNRDKVLFVEFKLQLPATGSGTYQFAEARFGCQIRRIRTSNLAVSSLLLSAGSDSEGCLRGCHMK
ncbi:hypothetical protein N7463_006621 [Penicillium fimorum]|uniref:Uncharacterized protein n=1 Tax=Penicillium fimorum TaxID=1882269 RepID=A0A9W9XUR1_9EURO|nr:hypothetical protein N7463_006621 [Penicillium fimorum]